MNGIEAIHALLGGQKITIQNSDYHFELTDGKIDLVNNVTGSSTRNAIIGIDNNTSWEIYRKKFDPTKLKTGDKFYYCGNGERIFIAMHPLGTQFCYYNPHAEDQTIKVSNISNPDYTMELG